MIYIIVHLSIHLMNGMLSASMFVELFFKKLLKQCVCFSIDESFERLWVIIKEGDCEHMAQGWLVTNKTNCLSLWLYQC